MDDRPAQKPRSNREPLPEGEAYDPFEEQFVSQNQQNEFRKGLEQNQREK